MYWSPVYAFFRRDGMAEADARDLTQGLFAELLERGAVWMVYQLRRLTQSLA